MQPKLLATVACAILSLVSSADTNSPVLIHLSSPNSVKLPAREGRNQAEYGKLVAETLKARTLKASARIREMLAGEAGVEEVTPIWITNSLRVRAPQAVLQKVRSLNGVTAIVADVPREASELLDDEAGATLYRRYADEDKIGWGVEKVGAPEVWGTYTEGKGALVAVIDSGVNTEHPDLKPNLFVNTKEIPDNGIDDDENGFIDDVNGWNFEDKNGKVADSHGHGTQAAGLVLGNGASGTRTGVAPAATLLPIRSCCRAGAKVFESNTWEAIQYAIQMGAKVISMSLSAKHPSKPTYDKWRAIGEIELQAGILHVNSAGNRGKGYEPFNIGAPATNPPAWFHPDQTPGKMTSMLTIGATDKEDKIRRYSSRGPVSWKGITGYDDYPFEKGKSPGLVKPEVCGPSEMPSTSMDGKSYTASFGGTSSATPVVAGVVALLVSVKPDLTMAQATEALEMSAVRTGGAYDNDCGAGRVDASAAVKYVLDHF